MKIQKNKQKNLSASTDLQQRSSPFLLLYLMCLIPTAYLLLTQTKPDIHLNINAYHHPSFDIFFRWTTHLGEPLVVIPIAFILWFWHRRHALTILLATALSGGLTMAIKSILQDDMRPFKLFQYLNIPLHLVPDVRLHEYDTFPSGHTALAFSFYFTLSLIVNRRWVSIVCFLLAFIVAYSRMYLSAHFLVDVTVGSAIGVVFGGWSYRLTFKTINNS